MKYSICILAAGRGSRTNLDYNKVFYKFKDGKTVLDKSVDLFSSDIDCEKIVVVCAEYEKEEVLKIYESNPKVEITVGGATRQDSVSNGLEKIDSEYVFIHDGARPYLNMEQINELKDILAHEDACLLMVPSVDTIKIVENGYVKMSLDRSLLYNAQTPQCFKTSLIKECHKKAKLENKQATDDAQLVEWYSNVPVKVVVGDSSNIKITNPGDLPA